MRIKKSLVAVAATAMIAALAACSSGPGNAAGSTSPASNGAGGKQTTVSFLSWDNQTTMQPFVDKFEQENPDIKIAFSYAPPVAQYIQTLQTRLSAGTAPDIFIITAENRIQLMNQNLVTDITDQPFMSNIADAAKVPYTKDGKVYGMATSSWGGGILYNVDMLNKVGFTGGTLNSWSDFLDLCQKLKDTGVTPYLDAIDSVPVTLDALVGLANKANGGTMDEQIADGKLTFAGTWTQPLTLYDQLVQKGYLDKAAAGLTDDQVLQEFEAGRVAMISTGSWTPAGIRQAAPSLNFKFMAVPGANAGESFWAGAVSPALAINIKSTVKDDALKFLDFMQNSTQVAAYNKATGSIMTTKDFTPVVDPSLSDMAQAVRNGDFYLPMSSWPKDSDALQTQITSLLQQMVSGSLTPAQVAQQMDQKLATLN